MSKKDRDKLYFYQFAALRTEIETMKLMSSQGKDTQFEWTVVIDRVYAAIETLAEVVNQLNIDLDKVETEPPAKAPPAKPGK